VPSPEEPDARGQQRRALRGEASPALPVAPAEGGGRLDEAQSLQRDARARLIQEREAHAGAIPEGAGGDRDPVPAAGAGADPGRWATGPHSEVALSHREPVHRDDEPVRGGGRSGADRTLSADEGRRRLECPGLVEFDGQHEGAERSAAERERERVRDAARPGIAGAGKDPWKRRPRGQRVHFDLAEAASEPRDRAGVVLGGEVEDHVSGGAGDDRGSQGTGRTGRRPRTG
jgi:hypothetical protein